MKDQSHRDIRILLVLSVNRAGEPLARDSTTINITEGSSLLLPHNTKPTKATLKQMDSTAKYAHCTPDCRSKPALGCGIGAPAADQPAPTSVCNRSCRDECVSLDIQLTVAQRLGGKVGEDVEAGSGGGVASVHTSLALTICAG